MQCFNRQTQDSDEEEQKNGFWWLLVTMGCAASGASAAGSTGISGLSYDTKGAPISAGADKYVFSGTYKGDKKVAVIIARRGGERRILHEIGLFRKIGKHPHIIEMLCDGTDAEGMPLAALEAVEPIGYDMSRLVNQYSWTGQVVPGSLMCKLVGQLISALKHLHSPALKLIHQDLKVQNVLVNTNNEAKLIDMGIVAKMGDKGKLKAAYLAPEVCSYETMTEKVDCWGVGLIMHQVYQKRATLLHIGSKVQMKRGMPSAEHPMADDVREVMCGLLLLDPQKRWSLDQVLGSAWFAAKDSPEKYMSFAAPVEEETRKYLRKYQVTQPAYAARIGSSQASLIGKKLSELDFGKKFGITILLIAHSGAKYERVPGKDTTLKAGTWVYFGVNEDDNAEDDNVAPALTHICQTLYGKNFDPKDKGRDIADAGQLVAFTLEFDCFQFPDRGAAEYVLGPTAKPGQTALNLRKTCNINIAGVVTAPDGGEPKETWYPRAEQVVKPGDIGLVVRAPRTDGLSDPTVRDSDLTKLMDVKALLEAK